MILVTGGAGFIGANFVLDWLAATGEPVVNLDLLTYAGNLGNLASLAHDARHDFVRGDIGDWRSGLGAADEGPSARNRQLRR
jgi:dTDP-glucose 4,6-dehydratase